MSYIFKKGDIVRVKKVVGESDVEKVSFQQMVGEF